MYTKQDLKNAFEAARKQEPYYSKTAKNYGSIRNRGNTNIYIDFEDYFNKIIQ
jgi:hypothetical protein